MGGERKADDKAWPVAKLEVSLVTRSWPLCRITRGDPLRRHRRKGQLQDIQRSAGRLMWLQGIEVCGSCWRSESRSQYDFGGHGAEHARCCVGSAPRRPCLARSAACMVAASSPSGARVGNRRSPDSIRVDQIPVDAVFDGWSSLQRPSRRDQDSMSGVIARRPRIRGKATYSENDGQRLASLRQIERSSSSNAPASSN